MELAKKYLSPPLQGIEIGASKNNPFPGINAWNVDRFFAGVFQQAQMELAGGTADIDIVGTGQRLPVTDDCVDFLLASHVLEHMADTIRTLREWDRVVKPSGIIFMIIPHKERTFDKPRPRTPLEHHLADYALGTTIASDPLVPTSHYHVWITEDVIHLIEYLNRHHYLDWKIEDVEDVDSKVGNGFTIVARKRSRPEEPGPRSSSDWAFHQLTLKLPFQAVGRSLHHILPGEFQGEAPPLPRGLYQCVSITGGFPPKAGPLIDLEVGEPVDVPCIEAAWVSDDRLYFAGRDLTPTTWLEAIYPGGVIHRVLPEYKEGCLFISLAGLKLPDSEILITPSNLPPGGGSGPLFSLRI